MLSAEGAEAAERLARRRASRNAAALDAETFVAHARVAGATPMFDWLGDEPGTVFSY